MTCSDAGRMLMPLAALALGFTGCTRPPLTVPVKGVVLLDGEPLTSGIVQFQPSAGQPAAGQIAADGSFTLSRHTADDGVPPGTYRVAVIAFDPQAEVQAVENLIVPVKYTRFGSSGIEFTVFPGTIDPVVINLSSDVAAPAERPQATPDPTAGQSSPQSSDATGVDDARADAAHSGV